MEVCVRVGTPVEGKVIVRILELRQGSDSKVSGPERVQGEGVVLCGYDSGGKRKTFFRRRSFWKMRNPDKGVVVRLSTRGGTLRNRKNSKNKGMCSTGP